MLDRHTVCSPGELRNDLLVHPFIVPLFTPSHRQLAVREAESLGLTSANAVIDPTVAVPRRLVVGNGTFVNGGCSLAAASEIGRFVFINRAASIGHHNRLSDFVSIGPGAVLAGNVVVEQGSVIGAAATILPKVTVGEHSVVGAGAVVTRSVPAHTVVVGNPARVVKENIVGYHDMAVS
jgi:sugar O-acyltransferase (sialic acid O-acetyltransferase NeuD family)